MISHFGILLCLILFNGELSHEWENRYNEIPLPNTTPLEYRELIFWCLNSELNISFPIILYLLEKMESLFLSKIEQNQEFHVDKELTDNKLIEKYFQRILDILFQTNDISLKYEFLLSFLFFSIIYF